MYKQINIIQWTSKWRQLFKIDNTLGVCCCVMSRVGGSGRADGVASDQLLTTRVVHEKRVRREIANSNERKRMQSINAGFQSLRLLLPRTGPVDRLSKVCFDVFCRLILSPPIPLRLYALPYWSNPPFLIFDIRALWRSGLSARAPECQKLTSSSAMAELSTKLSTKCYQRS